MKRSVLFGWIVLLILGTVLALHSVAIAGSGNPSGNPSGPPGLLISPYAQGTKLYGVIAVEFYPHGSQLVDAKVWLRLRKGSSMNLFTGQINNILSTSPAVIQTALMDAADPTKGTISDQINSAFFNGLKTNIALKNIDNYIESDFQSFIDLPTCNAINLSPCVPFIVIADVELAAY